MYVFKSNELQAVEPPWMMSYVLSVSCIVFQAKKDKVLQKWDFDWHFHKKWKFCFPSKIGCLEENAAVFTLNFAVALVTCFALTYPRLLNVSFKTGYPNPLPKKK